MKTRLLSLSLLLMLALSFAFPIENYLFPNEKRDDIKAELFSLGSDNYTLLKLKDKEIMLIKDNKIIQDQAKIKDVIKTYYRQKYFPADSELKEITDLAYEYNHSRNDGTRFKGKEEYACRDVLLLNGINTGGGSQNKTYCIDNASCTRIGTLFYVAPYTEGIRQSVSIDTAILYVKTFAFASDGTGNLTRINLALSGNFSEDNLNSSLTIIKNSVPQLRAYKNTIESHITRTPRLNDSADRDKCFAEKCYGLCPDLDFNDTALNLLDAKATALLAKVGPIANYDSISLDIYGSTKKRIDFLDKESKGSYYGQVFEQESEAGYPAIKNGENALRIVMNSSLQAQVARLKELHNLINTSIIRRNFTSIDENLDEYESLAITVNKMVGPSLATYNKTVNAKKQAETALFLLQTKDLESQPAKRFEVLKQALLTIDATFKEGLRQEDYASLEAVYLNATNEATLISRMQNDSPLNAISLKMRAMARNTNQGVGRILSSAGVSADSVASNRTLIFGGTSLFVFLSMASVIGLALLMVYIFLKSITNIIKIAMVAVLLAMLGIMLGFTTVFYIYLDKTANSAELEEFALDFAKKDSKLVFVDFVGTNAESQAEMGRCGNSVFSGMNKNNKSVTLYKFYGDTCTISPGDRQAAASECLAGLQNSSAIVLKYSAEKKKPAFTAVYDIKAYLYGDTQYYRSCVISGIIS